MSDLLHRPTKVKAETRVPDAVQRILRCSASRDPQFYIVRHGPRISSAPHSASKTRVNALMALRSIRGTRPALRREAMTNIRISFSAFSALAHTSFTIPH